MRNLRLLFSICCCGLTTILPAASRAAETTRPRNIVIIVADDAGYGDFGCYGATKIATPHIDRLAAEGLRFTDAYAPASMCTPTRYSLLTGQYSFRNAAVARHVLPGDAGIAIPSDRRTLANLLSDAGYTTALIGKWHLGLGEPGTRLNFNNVIAPGPLQRGFDRAFFIPATVDRVPTVFIDGDRVAGLNAADPIEVDYNKKIGTDPTGKENPERLKLHPSRRHDGTIVNGISRIGFMTGGHSARWIDEIIADKITSEAVKFIEQNRDKPFFLLFATHDPHVPRAPNPRFVGKTELGPRGDALVEFDWSVGEVMAALKRIGAADDTLVLVTSDNGAVLDDGYQDGSSDPHGHSCNGPLRGYKAALSEGGCRIPLIARWPGHVPVGESSQIVALIDMMATFAAMTGQTLVDNDAPDSIDVSNVLLGREGAAGREDIVMQNAPGDLAIRAGDWKYIPQDHSEANRRMLPKGADLQAPELYDLVTDPGEEHNLADARTDIIEKLSARLKTITTGARSRP